MKKGRSITLLSLICLVTAFLAVMTFISFPVGVKNYNGVLGAIEKDYDIAGGTAYNLTLARDNTEEVEDINEVISILEYRLTALGYQAFSVKAVKDPDEAVIDYDIRIEARGETNDYGEEDVTSLSSDIAVAAAYGELQFYGGSEADPTDEILTDGQVIDSAEYAGVVSDGDTTYYQVNITFTDYAYDEIMSSINAGTFYFRITLGDTELMSGSEALSASYFSGRSLGLFVDSEAGARQAALQISSGGLPYRYEVSDPMSVTAPYGENTALWCLVAVLAVAAAFIVAFFVCYRGYGFIAGLTLILSLLLQALMLIAVPGIKLSLGGVVGIIFATVLTADGLIITAKRIQEEYSGGKMVKTAVKTGFRRSIMPVIGGTVACGIIALALFLFVNGTLKGFAITFGIGAVISFISNMLFARMFAALILPIAGYGDKFLNLKRAEA